MDEREPDADGAQPRVLRRGERQDLRHRRPHRRTAYVTASSNTDVVEEYDPARDLWGVAKARMPTPRSGGGWATYNGRIYVSGGEGQNERYNAAFRALEAYEPATNRWEILPSMPGARARRRGGVHRQQVPHRQRKDGRRRVAGRARQGDRRSQRDGDAGGRHAIGWWLVVGWFV